MTVPVLFRDHFQHAYVVRNMDGAMASFRDNCGVGRWQVMPMPEGSPIRAIGLAYVQKVMIELIEAVPGAESIYRDWLPASDSAARFHHLGYLIDSEAEYQALVRQFDAAGMRAAFAGSSGDILDFHYADTVAQLGHFCELVHLRPAGKDFFSQVPQNG
ncbi:MAG: VOC family protein [Gammaproteobacteria bacterium]